MATSNFDNPDSTGYVYFEGFGRRIRYVMAGKLETQDSMVINKVVPKHPQARRNKRDNFKKHNQ